MAQVFRSHQEIQAGLLFRRFLSSLVARTDPLVLSPLVVLANLGYLWAQLHPCLLSSQAFQENQAVQVFRSHQEIPADLLFRRFLSSLGAQTDLLVLSPHVVPQVLVALVVPFHLVIPPLLFRLVLLHFL